MANNVLPDNIRDRQAEQSRQREQNRKRDQIYLYTLRQAVANILDDYEQTAQTLDTVTNNIDGVSSTSHADDVQSLKNDLLTELQVDGTLTPPWERDGYDTRQQWLDAK
jgi:hypothetical protein